MACVHRYQQAIAKCMNNFIHDENETHYTMKGIQWYSPEKNSWKWLEIHILPADVTAGAAKGEAAESKLFQQPSSKPEFGEALKIQVSDPLDVGDHTEYLVTVRQCFCPRYLCQSKY